MQYILPISWLWSRNRDFIVGTYGAYFVIAGLWISLLVQWHKYGLNRYLIVYRLVDMVNISFMWLSSLVHKIDLYGVAFSLSNMTRYGVSATMSELSVIWQISITYHQPCCQFQFFRHTGHMVRDMFRDSCLYMGAASTFIPIVWKMAATFWELRIFCSALSSAGRAKHKKLRCILILAFIIGY